MRKKNSVFQMRNGTECPVFHLHHSEKCCMAEWLVAIVVVVLVSQHSSLRVRVADKMCVSTMDFKICIYESNFQVGMGSAYQLLHSSLKTSFGCCFQILTCTPLYQHS